MKKYNVKSSIYIKSNVIQSTIYRGIIVPKNCKCPIIMLKFMQYSICEHPHFYYKLPWLYFSKSSELNAFIPNISVKELQ